MKRKKFLRWGWSLFARHHHLQLQHSATSLHDNCIKSKPQNGSIPHRVIITDKYFMGSYNFNFHIKRKIRLFRACVSDVYAPVYIQFRRGGLFTFYINQVSAFPGFFSSSASAGSGVGPGKFTVSGRSDVFIVTLRGKFNQASRNDRSVVFV